METWKHGKMETRRQGDMDKETWTWRLQTLNGKREPRGFFLFHLPFDHRADGSLSFVHLSTKKEMEVIHL
jgi:hypothetical protein